MLCWLHEHPHSNMLACGKWEYFLNCHLLAFFRCSMNSPIQYIIYLYFINWMSAKINFGFVRWHRPSSALWLYICMWFFVDVVVGTKLISSVLLLYIQVHSTYNMFVLVVMSVIVSLVRSLYCCCRITAAAKIHQVSRYGCHGCHVSKWMNAEHGACAQSYVLCMLFYFHLLSVIAIAMPSIHGKLPFNSE